MTRDVIRKSEVMSENDKIHTRNSWGASIHSSTGRCRDNVAAICSDRNITVTLVVSAVVTNIDRPF